MSKAASQKHPCPDCTFCQWCSDDRCRLCLNDSSCCRNRKLSLAEQIRLYDSLNPPESPPDDLKNR
ncbi:MAG: hypothetical protein M0T70_05975 [Geobacteraceae bacterium]|nr:hypothetical protein [Geobacteraceae bacterium]